MKVLRPKGITAAARQCRGKFQGGGEAAPVIPLFWGKEEQGKGSYLRKLVWAGPFYEGIILSEVSSWGV